MKQAPSPNGADGRNGRGQFSPGNAGGPGNPHAAAVGRLRSALLRAVSEADVEAMLRALVEKAKAGDVAAAREVLDRTMGKPTEVDMVARLETVERVLAAKGAEG